jgi:hypothetical protein
MNSGALAGMYQCLPQARGNTSDEESAMTETRPHDVAAIKAGHRNYGLFTGRVFGVCGTDWRLTTVAANGQPGFAAYLRAGDRYEPHTLQILTVTAEGISRNSVFQGSGVFAAFGLPAGLDARGPAAG